MYIHACIYMNTLANTSLTLLFLYQELHTCTAISLARVSGPLTRSVAVTEGLVRLCETQHCIHSGILAPRDVLPEV